MTIIKVCLQSNVVPLFCIVTSSAAVYAPPVIDEGMPSILPQLVTTGDKMSNIGSTFHVVRGGDVVVDCPSSGAIPVNSEEYVWYYKGMMVMDQTNFTDAEGNSIGKFLISTRPGGSTLTIKNAARSDNGYVQCSAFNPAGSDFASSRIRGTHAAALYILKYSCRSLMVRNSSPAVEPLYNGHIGN
jgi:hypothetical protein